MSTPALKMGMPRPRRSAVAKTGAYPNKSSFELRPVSASLVRKPARREDHHAVQADCVRPEHVQSDHSIWESQSVAVCKVSASGEVLRANRKFLELVDLPRIVPGMNAHDLLAESGAKADIESISIGANGEALLLLLPELQADERSTTAFRLLHDSVAQSVAALAMNLFLVHQSGATNSYPNAEKILRSSLDLVEQCAKEVRGICTLLQQQSKQAGRNCA
jgi:signal transduction histidine kinase